MVILVTLVLQGLTLPWLIRKLQLEDKFATIPEERQELLIQKKLAQQALRYLDEQHPHDGPPNDFLHNLRGRLQLDSRFLTQALDEAAEAQPDSLQQYQHFYLDALEQQRALLQQMNQREEFDEEIIRKYLAILDLEEYKLREKQLQPTAAE